MNSRRSTLDFVSQHLGRRELVWAGLRADDIEAISDLEQVAGSFSIVGGRGHAGAVPRIDFEDLAGVRVDLDAWDIEDHLESDAAHEFREALLTRLAGPTALLPYRPSKFLSSILFARRDRCLGLGLFAAHQAIFEHKPWVETSVASIGVPTVPWTYVADEEKTKVLRMLRKGPVLLRVSRSSGGAGLVRVDDPYSLAESWPRQTEAFAAVTPFLNNVVPLNVAATIWHDGLTISHPSIQLIGIPGCTNRAFGYCGNDFGQAAALDEATLDAIEDSVSKIAVWLRQYHYLGTFGVDFLVHEGAPLFTEINPRLQGSTHASSQLSSEAGQSCVILDHIAALLGAAAPARPRLRDLARSSSDLAHLVIHWTGKPAVLDTGPLENALRRVPGFCRVDVQTKPGVLTATGGIVVRLTTRVALTETGYELARPWNEIVNAWVQSAQEAHASAMRKS